MGWSLIDVFREFFSGQIDEDIGTGETITAIVRKEGQEVRPEDTRCIAKSGSGRCKNDISYDEVVDTWSKFCTNHRVEDEKARESGDPRVARFDATEGEDEGEDEDEVE